MKLKIKKLHKDAIIPKYQTKGAAGFDLHAIEGGILGAGCRTLIKTGLAVEVPEGYELQVRPRSGLALNNGISVVNSPGTVDCDFRGEVGVILINHGVEFFQWKPGDRIAQAVIAKVEHADIEVVETLSETERGEGGFGSTNKKFVQNTLFEIPKK